ncbi:hypothetical protein HK101_006350, partial [Irineochytrium annulatum]
MNALVLTKGSSKPTYHPVSLTRVPVPVAPDADHVVVQVKAASLNHRDVYIREGLYPGIVFGSTLGSDGAGVISSSAERSLIGQRVVINPTHGWDDDKHSPERIGEFGIRGLLPLDGTFAEYVVVPRPMCVPIPSHMTFVDASTLPVAGVTAWRAVFTLGEVKAGQR